MNFVNFFTKNNVRICSGKLAQFRLFLLGQVESGETGDFSSPGDGLFLANLLVIIQALLMVAFHIGPQHYVSQSFVGIGPPQTHWIQLKSLD